MLLSMVWIRQLNSFQSVLIAVHIIRTHSGYPSNAHWSSCYKRICVSVKKVGEHAVNTLELKSEVELLLLYRLTLCRMSSDEEKSTSPVLPKDSVRGSSVSSDLQVGKKQPYLVHCYNILFRNGQLWGNLTKLSSLLCFSWAVKTEVKCELKYIHLDSFVHFPRNFNLRKFISNLKRLISDRYK